jgi:hypothetical protein
MARLIYNKYMKKLIIGAVILALAAFALSKIMTGDEAGPAQAVTIEGVTITPLEVVEDSRCPEGVQCIWAGTVKLLANISKPSGNWSQTLELGKPASIGAEEVTLVSASPNPKQGESIPFEKYHFEFDVKVSPDFAENPGIGGCFVGGCSSQLCSEERDAVSTCEWREAYACYKTAKCERQSNGQCGWTPTSELNACLMNAR